MPWSWHKEQSSGRSVLVDSTYCYIQNIANSGNILVKYSAGNIATIPKYFQYRGIGLRFEIRLIHYLKKVWKIHMSVSICQLITRWDIGLDITPIVMLVTLTCRVFTQWKRLSWIKSPNIYDSYNLYDIQVKHWCLFNGAWQPLVIAGTTIPGPSQYKYTVFINIGFHIIKIRWFHFLHGNRSFNHR